MKTPNWLRRLTHRRKKPNRAVPSVSYLETLPAELRTLILFSLAGVEDLRALVLASPVFYQQYLLDRRAVLASALRAELGNRVFVDAYAAQASATRYPLGSKRGRHSVTWFLDKYLELRLRSISDDPADAATAGNPSEDDLIRMVCFYRSVARLLASECAALFLRKLDPSLEVDALSVTEQRRLLRALYRFQLFCHLFGPSPRGSPGWPKFGFSEEIQVVFFRGFPPWEIEEVHCVYTLIREKYTSILDAIQGDVDPRDPKFADWGGPIAHPASYDLSSINNRINIRQGTATLGLRILQEILGATDPAAQSETMQKHMTRAGKTKFEQVLGFGPAWPFRRDQHGNEAERAEARGDRMRFDRDREDGPPLPWVAMWQGKWRNVFGDQLPEALKIRGYVFWDSKRLVRTGGKDTLMNMWWEELERVEMRVRRGY
ncbi:hypothetical protein C8A05DRAFT_43502 [Staphylotrichum tortipilum]|uniref:Uncharacterized protein n=1 Tax=Staphylotrichum tortipilum TaxID=2831512 RepID=A0AAN6RU87_9PEZI|nr:hypothetical protein C8A05DRAFT_43502 [Staphylotrichum longicolle]